VKNRYQVFIGRDERTPAFSSSWYFVATLYVVYVAGPATDVGRVYDARRGVNVNEFDFFLEID
jgi:hypothetical protein